MINIYDLTMDILTFGIWGALKAQRKMEENNKRLNDEMERILMDCSRRQRST
jgi:hypothetical protein